MAKRPAKKAVKKKAKKTTLKHAPPAPASPRYVPAPPPPAPPVPTTRQPPAEAVTAYERGIAALHRHDYKTASSTFQTLLAQYPTEGFLTDRARVYLELAARELGRRPAGSGNIEERLTAATLALNNHDDGEAARLAGDVLKDDRSQDLAAYLLAVVASRRGDVDTALAHLRDAININPECRLQARQDEEFDPLMDSDEFHALIEAPSSAATAAGQARKPVRKTGR